MIVTRAPLRITLGGGGSDLHPDGLCVTATINKYVSVVLTDNFYADYSIRYSHIETAKTVDAVEHPIIRRALAHYSVPPGIEVTSCADIPAGTGLGSSGAFSVALCAALAAWTGRTRRKLPETACNIDPVGWQDQYSAVYGGLNAYQKGEIPRPILADDPTLAALEANLVLFYTGICRDSADVLPKAATDPATTRSIAEMAIRTLEIGDMEAFAETLTAQWDAKLAAHPSDHHLRFDFMIRDAMDRGHAHGGKLVGAGDGGFLLFYAKDRARLRKSVTLREVPFSLTWQGVQ